MCAITENRSLFFRKIGIEKVNPTTLTFPYPEGIHLMYGLLIKARANELKPAVYCICQ